jgi:tripartite motif-containing protein 2/3/tripartite motif-containing protein 71
MHVQIGEIFSLGKFSFSLYRCVLFSFNSSEPLDIRDLHVIYSNIWEARNKWFNIGLGLNLEVSDLEETRQTYRDKADDCFLDMLKKWLRTSPRPMQSNLLTVLREKTVGFDQLAEELESKRLKRDRIINQFGMGSTKLTTKTSPAHSQVKFKSVIKIGAPMLILLLILFIIWNAQEANIGQYEDGEHIKGSPFGDTVDKKLFKIILGVKGPWGVVVNQRGEIVIAEREGHCISIFSPSGEKLRSFGSQGSGPGQFNYPRGVTVDDDGNILVADTENHRIQKFTSDNKHMASVGSYGSNRLQFSIPISVAIFPITKKIAISAYYNGRVQILNPDLTFNSSIGSEGSGSGEFSHPYDVAFDRARNMYVVDAGNDRIQVFNPKGKYLRQFGKTGKDDGELDGPNSIYIDSDNILYVTECGNHRISLFTPEGEFLTSFGSKGAGLGQFIHPCGITVDKQGRIYVADHDNRRIQIFAPLTRSPH